MASSLVGQRVRVHGLVKKPEYNGQLGTVQNKAVEDGRLCVILDKGNKELSLKTSSLEVLGASKPVEDTQTQEASSVYTLGANVSCAQNLSTKANTSKEGSESKKKREAWGDVTLEDLSLLNINFSQEDLEVHAIIPEIEGGEFSSSVHNLYLMRKELSQYIQDFGLHHDPRVIQIIGPAYFLACDAFKMSREDPWGWQNKCDHNFCKEYLERFHSDPRNKIFEQEEEAARMSDERELARAKHVARMRLAYAPRSKPRSAQAQGQSESLDGHEKSSKEQSEIARSNMMSKASSLLQFLRTARCPDGKRVSKSIQLLIESISLSGAASLSISLNEDKTFLCRSVGMSFVGLRDLFCQRVPPKLLSAVRCIFEDLCRDALAGSAYKLEPGRNVLAQRFAITYELLEPNIEPRGRCLIWELVEAGTNASVRGVELVVRAEEWTRGKGVRQCDGCKRSEIEVALMPCGGCRIVKYCSKSCQSRDWKQGHRAICKGMQAGDASTCE